MNESAEIPATRWAEYEGLVTLLLEYADPSDEQAPAVADAVARGALQDGHLWRNMRLSGRAEVRELLEAHFPELAAGNTKDMRWKKYLYKRLCGWPGFEG
jgi:nitrogen fixation protein NifQ